MLESNIDNKRNDEPNIFKQAICHFDWSKWKKAIQIKNDSFIENKTWKLTLILENW